jgi:transcriptional regulator with XRE-family HTH domain
MRAVAIEHWQEFGATIKSLRQTHGWSLRAFAREMAMSAS